MKKIITLSCLMLLCSFAGMAQKFALIDMEYILKNIPAYEMTNEQLSQVSKKWQNEVEAIQQEAQNMYKNYQSDLVFLSAEMKTKRMKKLLMGLGLSRNQVNRMVNTQRREGSKKVSNALYWIVAQKHINDCGPELLPCLSSLVLK